MIELENQIGEREQPSEQRHRAVEIVIWNGVQTFRTFKQREIVRDQTGGQQRGANAAGHSPAGV